MLRPLVLARDEVFLDVLAFALRDVVFLELTAFEPREALFLELTAFEPLEELVLADDFLGELFLEPAVAFLEVRLLDFETALFPLKEVVLRF